MQFIRSFFTSNPQQQTKHKVSKFLSDIGIQSKCTSLSLTFQYQFSTSINECPNPSIYFKQLVSRLSQTRSVSSAVKLLTIIHSGIYERDYNKEEIEYLEEMGRVCVDDEEQKKWFEQFAACYCSYLKKLPSLADLYRRAKTARVQATDQGIYLTEVFRIINQINLLFPSICTLTNNIGRYYLTAYPQFPEFYRTLNKEITMLYAYLKLIIDQILLNYRNFDVEQLKCFMQTIPEIELTCDKIEDLLLNKYFKGKSIKAKIYFKEQKVQELSYFLNYQLQGKNLQQNEAETLSTDIRMQNISERNK